MNRGLLLNVVAAQDAVVLKHLALEFQDLLGHGDDLVALDHLLHRHSAVARRDIQREGLVRERRVLHEDLEVFKMTRNKAWAMHLGYVQGSSILDMAKARPSWHAIKPIPVCKNDLTMKFTKERDILLLDVVKLHELVLELKRDEHLVRCFDEQEHFVGEVDPEILTLELIEEVRLRGYLTMMRPLAVGREVQGDGVHSELLQHFVVGFERLLPLMPTIANDDAHG